jgi:Zn-dependent M28 family amino/carboxypeptidase
LESNPEKTMPRLPFTCPSAVPVAFIALLMMMPGCQRAPAGDQAAAGSAGFPPLDEAAVLRHTRALSSAEFEGRAPGTRGEELTVAYIAGEFAKAGIAPAGPDGTYFQHVPLIGITGVPSRLTFRKAATRKVLEPKDDFVAWSKRAVETNSLTESELVFVGYGVHAPDIGWDDYEGVDLTGKTMVVLVGDPPVRDPSDPSRLDPSMFAGEAMTYYGRWPYKFEMGAEKKAEGVLIVHETEPAGYGFAVVQGRLAELFEIRSPDGNMGRAAIEGWITLDRARELFELAGHDFEQLKQRAATREFKPVPLGVTASVSVRNTMRNVDSRNVLGRLEGADATLKDECVVFTAHWDHLGVGPAIDGETVRHGAVDNALAVAGLIELGRTYSAQTARPKRTLLFLAVTAEEQLMLGSGYYAQNPVYPLERTLAVLNLEMPNVYGKTSDLTVYGLGASDLDDYAREAAAQQGRVLKADPAPEQGWYYRSDHFPFAKAGVPAMWAGGGDDYVGKPPDYGRRVREEYVANRYHKPADKVRDDWDLSGAIEDFQVYFSIGSRVASAERYPEWKPGAEFRARREQMLRKAGS